MMTKFNRKLHALGMVSASHLPTPFDQSKELRIHFVWAGRTISIGHHLSVLI